TLIVSALFILGGIGMIKSSQFNQKLLSDGELYIHFQESNAGTNPDVKFYFRFYKNQIVDFRSNVIRYSATANFDTRFTEILQSGSIFQVRTKTNTGSYGDPDWDIKMTIDINAIGGYKEPKDSLKGTVTIEQYTGFKEDRKLTKDSYDADFIFIINSPGGNLITAPKDIGKEAANEQDAGNKAMLDQLRKNNTSPDSSKQPKSNNTAIKNQGTAVAISEKAYFFDDGDGTPSRGLQRNTYLVKGNQVSYNGVQGDFIYATFTDPQGKTTMGWMLKSDFEFVNH